jgi:YegS/Rv2252/BmrU family lipid kinase
LKIAIILNGISLQKKYFYGEVLPALQAVFPEIEILETLSQHDGILLGAKAVDRWFDIILAAGGDGTVHQVANGMLSRRHLYRLPPLGIIPIGSGNDFARCLDIRREPAQLIAAIQTGRTRSIDVGHITHHKTHGANETARRYFINEADIGMGPDVVRKVTSSGRPFGSAVAYYVAILSTFANYKPLPIKATTPTWTWEGEIRTLAIANGNYYGNGICISPDARPDDGQFGTFICGPVSVFDFIRFSGDLKKGRYVRIPDVSYNHTNAIELTSNEPCMIETDGEIIGYLPAKIELLPNALSVLC